MIGAAGRRHGGEHVTYLRQYGKMVPRDMLIRSETFTANDFAVRISFFCVWFAAYVLVG